ncbi:UDP-N-acetylmuramoyl-L-alanine--D-glutamate ligase [Georgenia sp. Z1491]|uniref:UDP-N-acetylmuramoyl-L-alanine--D-glutamate ligase n=1 Tax=Georgenia sp. Z1491 TaxID=3416707 RepID=UPI003CF8C6E9
MTPGEDAQPGHGAARDAARARWAEREARDLAGARVAVVGLGTSGRAALRALQGRVGALLATDGRDEALQGASVEVPDAVLASGPTPRELAEVTLGLDPDVLVVSPGIPATSDLLVRAQQLSIPVWSEIELAWRLQRPRPGGGYAPWLAVTGTNGKTTTVTMTAAILAAAGLDAPAVGNVGTPPVQIVTADGPGPDVLPAELSSFQLHATHSLAPLAAVCLNLAPDHLDWHGSYAAYRADKARVYRGVTGLCVYSEADPDTRAMVEEADVAEGARAVGLTLGPPAVSQVGVVDGVLAERVGPGRWTTATEIGEVADLAHLLGDAAGPGDVPDHLVLDALAAATLARAAGVEPHHVRDGLRAYRAEDHRATHVATLGGVTYVDDSKATNAHAADAALSAHAERSVVWIAGGLAKGARFDDLVAAHAHRLAHVVLIGKDREPMLDALARHAPEVPLVEVTRDDDEAVMERAVGLAAARALPGQTVLLAPASASMDQFRSYDQRGRAFADAVRALATQEER